MPETKPEDHEVVLKEGNILLPRGSDGAVLVKSYQTCEVYGNLQFLRLFLHFPGGTRMYGDKGDKLVVPPHWFGRTLNVHESKIAWDGYVYIHYMFTHPPGDPSRFIQFLPLALESDEALALPTETQQILAANRARSYECGCWGKWCDHRNGAFNPYKSPQVGSINTNKGYICWGRGYKGSQESIRLAYNEFWDKPFTLWLVPGAEVPAETHQIQFLIDNALDGTWCWKHPLPDGWDKVNGLTNLAIKDGEVRGEVREGANVLSSTKIPTFEITKAIYH